MGNAKGGVLNIGIVGAGSRGVGAYGALLARRDDARVAALADVNPARLAAARGRLGHGVACFESPEAMLRAGPLDGVVVTSPDCCHADHAVAVLRGGVKHVLVEKPLATSAGDCLRVAEAARASGGRVAIGFNMRHLPLIRCIKGVIDDGTVGELMMIENQEFYDGGRTYMARWNRRRETSGGLWVHKGSHDFDVFNWWNSRGNPVRVSAFAGVNALRPDRIPFALRDGVPVGPNCRACDYQEVCPDFAFPADGADLFGPRAARADGYLKDLCVYTSDKDTHDNGIAIVEYDNNVRASHSECFVCNFTDRIYTVVGDRGTLMANLERPNEIRLRPRWGADSVIDVPDAPEGNHGGSDPLLLADFLDSVRRGTDATSNVRDGARAVAVGQAAEVSWRTHRLVNVADLADLSGL